MFSRFFAQHALLERIKQHLIDHGSTPAEADAQTKEIAKGGIGGILQWIVANAPQLYAFAAFIAALFGIPLPPLPPIPHDAAPSA